MSPAVAQVKKEYIKLRKAYLGRRTKCLEIVGHIAENKGVRNAKLMEDIGLEADEDVGVDKKNFPLLT